MTTFPEIRPKAEATFAKLWQEWRLREKRLPSRWATEERLVTQGPIADLAGGSIKYDHARMPHCIDPMDSADDDEVKKIVLWLPIRDGKTLGVCLNIFGRTVTDDPGNIYSVHPTDDDAERFSSGDLDPLIDLCLAEYFVKKKSRDPGRTIAFKKFKGGWVRIVSAGSLTKFTGTSVRVLFLHEIDRLDPEAVHKAMGRTTGYANAIIVEEGTCTLSPTSDENGKLTYRSKIQESYEFGDKRKWFCECRGCGHLQWLKFAQIKCQGDDYRSAQYHCEKCDAPHDEKQWRAMAGKGKWYPTAGLTAAEEGDIRLHHHKAKAKDFGVRSYWRNGFNSLLPKGKGYKTKLHQFKAEGEAAKRSKVALEVWTNEIACEVWNPDDESTEPPAHQPILDGREDYATESAVLVPASAVVLTTMTDLHANRLEVEFRAWARTEESWGLGHFVVFGDTSRPEVWQEWIALLGKKFPHALGGEIAMSLSLVDGGWAADRITPVLRLLREKHVPGVSGKIIMSKGVPRHEAVIIKQWATINDRAKGIHIGTWYAKSLLYERLRWHSSDVKPDAGFVHFGKCYSDEFIRQAVSEKSVMQVIRGKEIESFKNPEGNRNEGIDLIVGNLAAFRRRRWDWETLARELTVREEKPEPPPAPPVSRPRGTRSPFGKGWSL